MEAENPSVRLKPSPETVRSFIALLLPDRLHRALAAWLQKLQSNCPSDCVRWSRPEQIHLTLKFLGSTPLPVLEEVENSLRRAVEAIRPFELVVEKVGCFPNFQLPRIVWVGITGQLEPLLELQSRIEGETAHLAPAEQRVYRPHLTLGRVRPVSRGTLRRLGGCLQNLKVGEIGRWQVEEVALMQSQLTPTGAHYSPLAVIPLAATSK